MIILILGLGILIPALYADVAVEGVSTYSYQYHIVNVDDFPDYLFLTSSAIWGWEYPHIIENGTFGGGYKLDAFILHAILAPDIDVNKITGGDTEESSSNAATENDTQTYLSSLPFLTANITLPVGAFYEDKLGIDNVTVNLSITTLNATAFEVKKESALFGLKNGSVLQVGIAGDEDPIPPVVP
ncbi:MAG TPA: hypothetical protein PK024_09880 [Methanospirillum sp.]|uniref:hypothetical protein n=1 Tax=Methanospirillum sp. TaxID=45200 RepID=UPI002D09649E|nr:hypothetical protein [Methanospirillum sp.]HOJ97128.1 hypothetical protein [Methanospirillum sp.]HPP77029.1 hypothetical protein [Methanospirillum sp.]